MGLASLIFILQNTVEAGASSSYFNVHHHFTNFDEKYIIYHFCLSSGLLRKRFFWTRLLIIFFWVSYHVHKVENILMDFSMSTSTHGRNKVGDTRDASSTVSDSGDIICHDHHIFIFRFRNILVTHQAVPLTFSNKIALMRSTKQRQCAACAAKN